MAKRTWCCDQWIAPQHFSGAHVDGKDAEGALQGARVECRALPQAQVCQCLVLLRNHLFGQRRRPQWRGAPCRRFGQGRIASKRIMRPPIHLRFVDKAAAALTSAVEVYNKPSFAYREETFAILALNAWELLLKGKVLADAGNDIKVLRIYDARKTKSGVLSKKVYLKRNRTNNPQSIGFGQCLAMLDKGVNKLAPEVKSNLVALTEIRDNSVHFVTASRVLAKQAQELSSASVKNFVLLAKLWFKRDLSKGLHLVMPLSFITGTTDADTVVVSPDESRLIKYLQSLAAEKHEDDSEFAVALRLELTVEKSNLSTASKVQLSKDGDAVKVMLSEQDIRDRYPWDYKELCARLAKRYTNFKQDKKFHSLRKPLLADDRYAKSRYLDPGNPKSPKKDYYSSSVMTVMDPHYTLK